MPDSPLQPLRFLHIPKTAGSTFRTALFRIYPGEKFVFHGNISKDEERFGRLSAEEKQGLALCYGHMPWHNGIPEVESMTTITFVREPIERVTSWLHHLAEGKSPHMIKFFPDGVFDVDYLLEREHRVLDNLQTQYLLGEGNYAYPKELGFEELVDRAVGRLTDEARCFGVADEFDDSLLLFKRELGWPWPVYGVENRRDPDVQVRVTSAHVRKIAQLNAIDIEVYQKAKRIFGSRVRTRRFRIAVERAALRLKNRADGKSDPVDHRS